MFLSKGALDVTLMFSHVTGGQADLDKLLHKVRRLITTNTLPWVYELAGIEVLDVTPVIVKFVKKWRGW